jgi:hypothetical protein
MPKPPKTDKPSVVTDEKSQRSLVTPSSLKIVERIRSGHSEIKASMNKAFEVKKIPKSETEEKTATRRKKTWVAKPSANSLMACCEVVGQEGIRLLSPFHQHKTRFWLNEDKLGVISEKINEFTPLTAQI